MSKIGNAPITVPDGVTVTINDGHAVVKGPKGELTIDLPNSISVKQEDATITIARENDKRPVRAMHGFVRASLQNAVTGVANGWDKKLEIVGTGFNVKMQGENLEFKLGFSHPVIFKKVDGVSYKTEGNNKVIVSGINKQLVGQVAYQIKTIKQPDAYKGKGLRYEGEQIRLKPGKKAKA